MDIVSLAKLFLLFACLGLSYADCACKRKLRQVGIIPKYAYDVCTTEIDIHFQNGNYGGDVDCGNKLSLIATEKQPKVTFDGTKKCDNFTLLFFDPDVFSFISPYAQWLVANIKAVDLKRSDLSKADVIFKYVRPGSIETAADAKSSADPTPLTEQRFTFFLYCQTDYISPRDVKNRFSRTKFHPLDYAFVYGLGNPVAGNFFYVKLLP